MKEVPGSEGCWGPHTDIVPNAHFQNLAIQQDLLLPFVSVMNEVTDGLAPFLPFGAKISWVPPNELLIVEDGYHGMEANFIYSHHWDPFNSLPPESLEATPHDAADWGPSDTGSAFPSDLMSATLAYVMKEVTDLMSAALAPPPSPLQEMLDLFPALTTVTAMCPVPSRVRKCPASSISIKNQIVHLNDDHEWTREDIADWLETLDVDLTVPSMSKGD